MEKDFIDSARYYVALGIMVSIPAALVFWFMIHPFVEFWRKLGYLKTYGIALCAMLAVGTLVFLARQRLLAVDLGRSYALMSIAVLPLGAAVKIRLERGREFGPSLIIGLPEVDPGRFRCELVTDGIYSRVRNPRYLEMMLALVACALFANYLAGYGAIAVAAVGIYFVVLLEENELRARFGAEYEEYCERVPRFIPL